jgi:hypothetical protein
MALFLFGSRDWWASASWDVSISQGIVLNLVSYTTQNLGPLTFNGMDRGTQKLEVESEINSVPFDGGASQKPSAQWSKSIPPTLRWILHLAMRSNPKPQSKKKWHHSIVQKSGIKWTQSLIKSQSHRIHVWYIY